MAPPRLASRLLSLPPILHKPCRYPMPGYSKGSRGLSVFPRVLGIFTETTISPSLWSRQRPDRYAFRAGRNLPDKEFRYLRTVIVTAAIDQRFSRQLRPKANRLP
jgi:hypothetical protein